MLNLGVFSCNGLQCPQGTFKCTVEKSTTADLYYLQTKRQCSAQNGSVLKNQNDSVRNPNPGQQTARVAEVDGKGNSFVCSNCNLQNYEQQRQQQQQNDAAMFSNGYPFQNNPDVNQNMYSNGYPYQGNPNVYSNGFPYQGNPNMFSKGFPFYR